MRTPFREISARLCPPDAAPVPQVEELRRDLRIKSQELEVKNAAANDKLKKMVKDQQEAEKKKVLAGRGGLVPGGLQAAGWGRSAQRNEDRGSGRTRQRGADP